MHPPSRHGARRASPFRRESAILAPLVTAVIALFVGERWLAILPDHLMSGMVFAWLIAMILVGVKSVVRHADCLAWKLGEPYGTMVLTLAVASIEILTIAIVMTTGDPNPTLARDTMFSVVMIVLNGLVGVSLLFGGLRHREQEYNLQGAISYLSVIISLAVFGLIVPNFTDTTIDATFSHGQEVFLIVMCMGLYIVFLAIQTTRHRVFFIEPAHGGSSAGSAHATHATPEFHSLSYHIAFLVGCLGLVIFLTEKMAILLNYGLDELKAPPALGALFVAMLVLAPEGLGGIFAALDNRMQRAVNILLGSALATLALTIPSVIIIGRLNHVDVILGLSPVDMVMLALTLIVSMLTFASGRTNVLQGAAHLMLFLAYLMLLVWH
ncbi:MAG: calcium:proton antiporter [Betaproteobacteria bacterium]